MKPINISPLLRVRDDLKFDVDNQNVHGFKRSSGLLAVQGEEITLEALANEKLGRWEFWPVVDMRHHPSSSLCFSPARFSQKAA